MTTMTESRGAIKKMSFAMHINPQHKYIHISGNITKGPIVMQYILLHIRDTHSIVMNTRISIMTAETL